MTICGYTTCSRRSLVYIFPLTNRLLAPSDTALLSFFMAFFLFYDCYSVSFTFFLFLFAVELLRGDEWPFDYKHTHTKHIGKIHSAPKKKKKSRDGNGRARRRRVLFLEHWAFVSSSAVTCPTLIPLAISSM